MFPAYNFLTPLSPFLVWSTGQKYQHFCTYLNKKCNYICYWHQRFLVVGVFLLIIHSHNYFTSVKTNNSQDLFSNTGQLSVCKANAPKRSSCSPMQSKYLGTTAKHCSCEVEDSGKWSCFLPAHGSVRLSISNNTKSCEHPFSRPAHLQLKPVLLKEEKGRCPISTLKESNLQKI